MMLIARPAFLLFLFCVSAAVTAAPLPVPGVIEAENAYRYVDNTPGNAGDSACGDRNLDMQLTADQSGNCNIGWTEPGEWVEYDIDARWDGDFLLALSTSSALNKKSIAVRLDGIEIATGLQVRNLGWQTFTDLVIPLTLTRGPHSLRVLFTTGKVNLDRLTVTVPPAGPAITLPARIEAEAFIAFQDSTAANQGDPECNSGAVDTQFTSDHDGVCNIGWTTSGEWTEYLVKTDKEEAYRLILRAASDQTRRVLRVEIDGIDQGGPVAVPNQGWQAFADIAVPIVLTQGEHRVRVIYENGSSNLNYLRFERDLTSHSDADGVTDDEDLCPDENGLVELHGCRPAFDDFDADGISDGDDQCPYTTRNSTPGGDGCSEHDLEDEDFDGFANGQDLCPHAFGSVSSEFGCPYERMQDVDRDRVIDALDLCPGFFGLKEFNGCPNGDIEPFNHDADNDGVPNVRDHCPLGPNDDIGPNGCALDAAREDSDLDGVANGEDICPHSTLGHVVNAAGCTGRQLADFADDDGDGVMNAPAPPAATVAPAIHKMPTETVLKTCRTNAPTARITPWWTNRVAALTQSLSTLTGMAFATGGTCAGKPPPAQPWTIQAAAPGNRNAGAGAMPLWMFAG